MKVTYDLMQSVKSDRYVLQSAGLPDEEQDGITCGHAPKLLVNFRPMAQQIVYASFSYNLKEQSGIRSLIKLYSSTATDYELPLGFKDPPTHGGKYCLGSK